MSWEEDFDERFVKDHWSNHYGVRFNERTMDYSTPTGDLESKLKAFIRETIKAERQALVEEIKRYLKQYPEKYRVSYPVYALLDYLDSLSTPDKEKK